MRLPLTLPQHFGKRGSRGKNVLLHDQIPTKKTQIIPLTFQAHPYLFLILPMQLCPLAWAFDLCTNATRYTLSTIQMISEKKCIDMISDDTTAPTADCISVEDTGLSL